MGSSSSKKLTSASALKALKAVDRRLSKSGLARTKHRQSGARSRNTGARGPRPIRNPSFARNAPEELITPAPLPRRAANGVEWLPVPGWDFPWLWAGFSTRKGGLSRAYSIEGAPGELNLGITASDNRETVLGNRRLFAEAITSKASTPLISLRQFHSNRIINAAGADAARKQPLKADGQMTAEPGLLLAIQTADCIPVLVADRRQRVVAAFHAGWRGTLKRIVETGVGQMRLTFGSHPWKTWSPPSVPASGSAVTPSVKKFSRSSTRNFLIHATCFARSTTLIPCAENTLCSSSPSARPATSHPSVPAFTSISI